MYRNEAIVDFKDFGYGKSYTILHKYSIVIAAVYMYTDLKIYVLRCFDRSIRPTRGSSHPSLTRSEQQ